MAKGFGLAFANVQLHAGVKDYQISVVPNCLVSGPLRIRLRPIEVVTLPPTIPAAAVAADPEAKIIRALTQNLCAPRCILRGVE